MLELAEKDLKESCYNYLKDANKEISVEKKKERNISRGLGNSRS